MGFLKDLIANLKDESPSKAPAEAEGKPSAGPQESEASKAPPPPPKVRVVIEAPVITDDKDPEESSKAVLIKATPAPTGVDCHFATNRELLEKDLSWHFVNRQSAETSPLARALFEIEAPVSSVTVAGPNFEISLNQPVADWESLARTFGQAAREVIEGEGTLVDPELVNGNIDGEALRTKIQTVIDEEINPGVAGHGGNITIEKIVGNTVTINMGGGCQGCSSAALTLKGGIERSLREAAPEMGALLDATDHSAGTNPYFS